MGLNRPYRRRRFLVARTYQARFITRLALMIFAIAGASSLIAMAILWNSMDHPESAGHTYVAAAFVGIGLTLLIELLISLPIAYQLGLRQSHRVVGPIARMLKAVEVIGSGDFSQRLVLRPGDALEDLAKAINRMAENLQKRSSKPS